MTYRSSGYLVGAARQLGTYRPAFGDYYADAASTDAAGSGTSSGNGLFSQLWGWVTGTVAAASDDPPAVVAWRKTIAPGGVAVRWPFADALHGELAERDPNVSSDGLTVLGYSYFLAPLAVINADRNRRGVDAIATNVILPIAEGSETFAHIITGTIGRAALVAGGALLAVNLLTRVGRR